MELLEKPTFEQIIAIREELGEDPDRLRNNVQLLQKWVSCQEHLPREYDNNLLTIFLRGCKHNLERAKKKLEMYFIVKTKVPELFCNREPTWELMHRYTQMLQLAILPKLTPDGYRITIFKLMCLNGVEWDTQDVLRYVYMHADIRIAEERELSGDIFIFDLENLKPSIILKYVTPLLRKGLIAAYEAYPQRLKQLHIVNPPPIADKFISITKPFLKEKIRNRFIVHNSISDLLKHIPDDIMPTEYGGTSGRFDDLVNNWVECIIKHKRWFQRQDDLKATGSIPETMYHLQLDDIIGVEGSFRKLQID